MRDIRPSASDQEVDDAVFGVGDVMGSVISMGGDLPGDLPGSQQDIQIEQVEQAVR